MALAVCPECERPVPIVSRGWVEDRDGRRTRQAWQVQPHPRIDTDTGGPNCDGTGKVVV